jgi:hypothetical protein
MGSNPVKAMDFSAIKICSTPLFGVEVKPLSPCCEVLRCVKNHFEACIRILRRLN